MGLPHSTDKKASSGTKNSLWFPTIRLRKIGLSRSRCTTTSFKGGPGSSLVSVFLHPKILSRSSTLAYWFPVSYFLQENMAISLARYRVNSYHAPLLRVIIICASCHIRVMNFPSGILSFKKVRSLSQGLQIWV